MINKRLVRFFIVFMLVIIIAFTAREAFATTAADLQRDNAKQASTSECSGLPSRYSLHAEIVKVTGTRLPYTEDGPAGIDGGLSYLLSVYRTCSK